jgi:hypothetical protein
MTREKANKDAVTADDARQSPGSTPVPKEADIAHRAYDLFLARGCEHGHDVDDWLQAERQLHDAMSTIVA